MQSEMWPGEGESLCLCQVKCQVQSQGVQGAQYMAGARETDQAGKLAGLDYFCLVDPPAG